MVATSAVGSGTTITIYLPRSHAALVRAAEAPPRKPIGRGRAPILIVEDNPEVADVTASLVEQLGYRTLRAENATEALNRLQRGDRIDLVFSDIVMPGSMNGIALAQEIGNRYPQIPVLLTSGYSDVVQAAESQFTILRKPFQLPALDKAIREALRTRRRGARRWRPRAAILARARNGEAGLGSIRLMLRLRGATIDAMMRAVAAAFGAGVPRRRRSQEAWT